MNIAFKALVGSHNYNLNTESSDRDYKVFYYPSFDNMYNGDKASKHKTSIAEDIEYHDIRKLPDMLWKSNVNFLEVLFSQEVSKKDSLYSELHRNRESIASMNLPYLWDACYGMMFQKMRDAKRDNEKGDDIKSSKSLYQVTRIRRFLYDYADTNFNDFSNSIYVKKKPDKDYLLSVKSGELSYDTEHQILIEQMKSGDMLNLKEKYKLMKREEGLNKEIQSVVRRYVKFHLANEIR